MIRFYMVYCKECSSPYSVKRFNLGYMTCLECGDKEASKQIKLKQSYVAPLFNKGGYQYIGTIDNLKMMKR